jgi:hypothetical protein
MRLFSSHKDFKALGGFFENEPGYEKGGRK